MSYVAAVTFCPSGRGKAQCAANPDYPLGRELDTSRPGKPYCIIPLPYPAPECGLWMVSCQQCEMTCAITAAGRPDDPISIKLTCLSPRSQDGGVKLEREAKQ